MTDEPAGGKLRAMWKGVLTFDDVRLPVKLYSAVEDRNIRFRLLHGEDGVPVEQRMLNPRTGETIDYADARRGLEVEPERFVIISPADLDAIEPEASRDIRITRFVEPSRINHQRYDRPYFLGPDENESSYYAFARALGKKEREGVARWVMRKKEYRGALRAREGHLVLITLRHAGEVIPTSALEAPAGRDLDRREREMGEKFIAALEEKFDPEQYRDEYRERVARLIEIKRRGGTVEVEEYEEKEEPEELLELLEASLAAVA